MSPDAPAPRRHFIDWSGPLLPGAAGLLADLHLEGRWIDLGEAVLALPGRRAGRRLTELLLEEARRRGTGLRPPRVSTVGGLFRTLHDPPLPPAEPVVSRWAWALTLRDAPQEGLAPLLPAGGRPDDLCGWFELAGVVADLHRELGGESLSFREVARQVAAGALPEEAARWSRLADLQDAYLERLAAMGWSDPETSRREALEQGLLRCREAVWLIGVVELPRLLRRSLGAALENGLELSAVVHAPAARADGFDAFGCVRREAWEEAPIDLAEERVRIVGGPADQAREVVRFLAECEGDARAGDVVVGVPDPHLAPLVEEGLAEVGVPSRAAAGTPLSQTAPVRALAAVADYLERREFDAFAALVRHPDVGAALGPAGASLPEAADRYAMDHLPGRAPGPLPGAGPVRDRLEEARSSLEGPGLLGALDGERPLGEWMPPLLNFLARLYGGRTLDRRRPREAFLLEVCEALVERAATLAELPADERARCTAAEAIRILLTTLAGQAVPDPPDGDAVELLGWLELHADDAEHLAVVGMNEGIVPELRTGDPFLPDGLRSRLGLPDTGARAGRDAYLLTAIASSRKAVRLVGARRGADGTPLRPSRLLLALGGEALAARVLRAFGDAGADPVRSGTPFRLRAGERSRFILPPEPELDAAALTARLRVTDFRALLQDPYRFALERLRKLERADDEAREMDGGLFGRLAHRVLERFGHDPAASADDVRAVRDRLDELLEEEAARRFGPAPLPAVRVQVAHLRIRLRAFAERHVAWVRDGWRVRAVEAGPEDPGVLFDVDGEPVRLAGRIDRVDVHPERGLWAVLDYKTGERGRSPERTHRRRKGGELEWLDLQLPLYLRLLEGVRTAEGQPLVPDVDPERVRLGFVSLPRDVDRTRFELADWGVEDLAAAEETARRLVRELRDGPVRFDEERWSARDEALNDLVGRNRLAGTPLGAEEADDGS